MTKGFIFLGIDDHNKTDNIECAYMLNLSLKKADPSCETCVVVHKFEHVPKRYEDSFDYIVELPFGRTDINHGNIYIDFWQIIHCTPFDENIFINTHSLAVDNIDSLWDYALVDDIVFGSARDFRGDYTRDTAKFKLQDHNEIIPFATDLIYFNKNPKVQEFFKMADPMFKGWRDVYRETLKDYEGDDFDITLMANIVAQSLGEQYETATHFDYTDLEINFCYDPDDDAPADWLDGLSVWITNNIDIKVNNHRQTGIFHYGNPRVIDKDTIRKLDDNYRKTKTTIKV
jgi:hypothetical protein